MKKIAILIAGLAVVLAGCSSGGEGSSAPAPSTADKGAPTADNKGAANNAAYADVQKLFNDHCTGCHGANGGKGGINLTTYDAVMKGGDDGTIVTAGDPDKSKLVDALRGRNGAMQMPKGQAPLPEEDIKKVESWIKGSA